MATRKASTEFRHRRILKTLYFFQLRRMLHTADLNIAVAVEGKLRLEHLFPAAADINIRTSSHPGNFPASSCLSFSSILRQIRIKHLHIADDDLCSRLHAVCNPRYTGHLLFQIVEIHTREQLFPSSLPFSGLQSAPAHRTHRYIPASAHGTAGQDRPKPGIVQNSSIMTVSTTTGFPRCCHQTPAENKFS